MNEYLFTINNALVMCADGSFDIDDTDYSCMYDIHRDVDGERPVIDLKSFKYKEWRDRKATWVSCPPPIAPLVMALEDQIQKGLDAELLMDEYAQRELARGVA